MSTPQPSPEPGLTPRRSHREHKLPTHLHDYICSIPNLKPQSHTTDKHTSPLSLNNLFSLNHHILPDLLIHNSQNFIIYVCNAGEPSSYKIQPLTLLGKQP